MSARPATLQLTTGERLNVPELLHGAIADASTVAASEEDADQAAAQFAEAFVAALHARGLLVVERARSNSRESVYVDTYALALDGKHAAERLLGTIGALVKGGTADAMRSPLLDDFSTGILTLVGRRPPRDRHRIHVAMLRLRAIAALIDGCGDVAAMPPFDDELVQFFNGEAGR